jgi:hypothetical protein
LTTWRLIPHQPTPGPRPSGPTFSGRAGLPWSLVVAGFAGMCALIGMETTVALLANERFAAGPGFVGLLLCVAGLTMTLTGRAGRRGGPALERTAGRRRRGRGDGGRTCRPHRGRPAVLAVLAAAAVTVSRRPGGADETMTSHRTAKDGT